MIVLIPLAAPSDPFFDPRDHHFPKPLIEVRGRPMIERVIDNLSAVAADVKFVFVLRQEDCRAFRLDEVVRLAARGRAEVVVLDRPTDGALCSCLMAIDHIRSGEALVIANGDQLLEIDLAAAVRGFGEADVGVLTLDSVHPRWSYVRADGETVMEAAEKRPISRHAIAGFYYFRDGADFLDCAMDAMIQNQSHEGRFFVSASINQAVLRGLKVRRREIAGSDYHYFYAPQHIEQYERAYDSAKAARNALGPLVVVPMAGQGSRFANAGYDKPKPFIDVAGRPMIERVMDNLSAPGADYLLLARAEHLAAAPATVAALEGRGDVTFMTVDRLTEGAACTVLLAREHIDLDRPILIANCDQILDFDCAAFIADAQARGLDGSILCFRDPAMDPKWSFAKPGPDGLVVEVQEKKAISDLATVGLYYFARGRDFVDAALDMIVRNERVNNEFYVCPVYNHAIRLKKRIGVFVIPGEAMHGIGTPEDLTIYLQGLTP